MGSRLSLLRRLLNRLWRQEAVVDRQYRRFAAADSPPASSSNLLISIIMPVHETPAPVLETALASVHRQLHQAWELCLADDGSSASVQAILQAAVLREPRVQMVRLERSGGIAAATNAALRIATGGFCVFMDHDDVLAPSALARIAAEVDEHPDADMVFSDEDQLDERGRAVSPFFKPGWDPELMLSQNLVGHLAAYRLALVMTHGGIREDLDGSQDYDLALRVSAAVPRAHIRHVPRVLYHWRQSRRSFSATHAERCAAVARRAVSEHVGGRARVVPNTALPQWNTADFAIGQQGASVSIVTADASSLVWARATRGVEIVDAAADATGEVLVFAGPLARAETGWLEVLAANARRREVGCVGGRIDDRRGRVVNAGFVLDPNRIAIAERCFADAGDPGYRGRFVLARSVSAVSLQCLAVRRELFEEVGGLDGAAGVYADVDLCLRLSALGYRCLWTPQTRVRTSQGVVRSDADGAAFMRKRWGAVLARDPFLNPNLTIVRGRLGLARQTRSNAS